MGQITFRIGNLSPRVKPTVNYNPIYSGENFRGQGGTLYSSQNAINLQVSLEFPRLTATEAKTLLYYCTLKPSAAFSTLEMQDRENVFDGITESDTYNRILNKVKIVSWEFEPKIYADNESIESARITVEEI